MAHLHSESEYSLLIDSKSSNMERAGGLVLHGDEIPRTESGTRKAVSNMATSPACDGPWLVKLPAEPVREKSCSFTKEVSRGTLTGRILYDHHDKLRLSLNFQAIHPYLSRERLIPLHKQKEFIPNLSSDAKDEHVENLLTLATKIENPEVFDKFLDVFQKLTVKDPVTRHDQVDRLLLLLSASKDKKCLEKFIKCLKDSSVDAGPPHTELAKDLEKALKETPDLSVKVEVIDKQNSHVTQLSVSVDGMRNRNEDVQAKVLSLLGQMCSAKCWCCAGPLLLLVILTIILMIIISQVPQVHLPSTSIVAHSDDVSELSLALNDDYSWVSSVDIQLGSTFRGGTCKGTVNLFRGLDCQSLNTTTQFKNKFETRGGFAPLLMYLLPGSKIRIELTGCPISSIAERDYVFIVAGVDAYNLCITQVREQRNCTCDASNCNSFSTAEYRDLPERTIVFKVNSTDYYSIFSNNHYENFYCGLNYSVFQVQYDLEQSAVQNKDFDIQTFETLPEITTTIEVNKFLQVDPPSCVLYQSNCSSNTTDQHANLNVTDVKRRTDVLLIPGIFLIFVLFLLFNMVCLFACLSSKQSSAKSANLLQNDDS